MSLRPYEPEPGDVTRRFRANSRIPYAQALIVLCERARGGSEDFAMGPMNVSAMLHAGLAVSGPEAVVQVISDLLEQEVPGLYEVDS